MGLVWINVFMGVYGIFLDMWVLNLVELEVGNIDMSCGIFIFG